MNRSSLCAARLVDKIRRRSGTRKRQRWPRRQACSTLLDQHLEQHNDWLALGRPTIADCAVYPLIGNWRQRAGGDASASERDIFALDDTD